MNTIKFDAAVSENMGKVRTNNEDNLYLNGKFLTPETRDTAATILSEYNTEVLVYGVFDGMGGEALGEEASFLAASTLRAVHAELGFAAEPEKYVRAAIEAANDRICAKMEETGEKRIGTTFAALTVKDDNIKVFNVGDSRVYLLRGGRLQQLSVDDTNGQRLLNMGVITKEQLATHPDRHKLTQHLGIFKDEMTIDPHVSAEMRLTAGDKLLLCSDGLTDMVDDAVIEQILSTAGTAEATTRALVNKALENGGRDNVTAMVVVALTNSDNPPPAVIVDEPTFKPSVQQAQAAAQPQMSAPQAAAPAPQAARPAQTAAPQTVPMPKLDMVKPKKSSAKLIAIIAAIVVLVGAAVAVTLLATGAFSDGAPNANQSDNKDDDDDDDKDDDDKGKNKDNKGDESENVTSTATGNEGGKPEPDNNGKQQENVDDPFHGEWKIKIDGEEKQVLTEGDKATLTVEDADGNPVDDITFKCDNPLVIEVKDNNTIKAKKDGHARIRALRDGKTVIDCYVTVCKSPTTIYIVEEQIWEVYNTGSFSKKKIDEALAENNWQTALSKLVAPYIHTDYYNPTLVYKVEIQNEDGEVIKNLDEPKKNDRFYLWVAIDGNDECDDSMDITDIIKNQSN